MRNLICSVLITAAATIAAPGALAQEPAQQQPGTPRALSVDQARELELKKARDLAATTERALVELKAQQDLGEVTFKFFSAGSGMLGDVVAGAPYAAITVNESVQTLADGNRIVKRSTSNVSRDGQGRVRREEVGENGAITSVMILDPVAGASYVLDPVKRTARKMPLLINKQAAVNWTAGTVQLRAREAQGTREVADLKATTAAGAVFQYSEGVNVVSGPPLESRREGLGTQPIEGVPAEGTRTITTIPAGQIGNERPIEIVSEQWYSRELQMTLSSRRADPRTGETTYRVTNLRRDEPDPLLFQVPADYTLQPVLEVRPEKIK